MESRKKRVLVVDDEEDLTWSIAKHLSKDEEKYELICVNSGRKALEVLSQLPVDLVISDIRMPEISGLDLLVKIKNSYPNTKVIIMTAYGSSEIQEEANQYGCLKYIEKPFEINELRQLIINAIHEKKGFEGKISEFRLTDLIQMNCLGRMTTTLYIEHEGSTGVIYFDEGNIIHAEYGSIEGEDAFYEILSWEGGNFTVEREKSPQKETIIKGWQSLLLEGMRRLDESEDINSEDAESERKKRLIEIDKILQRLIKIDGLFLAVVFDPDCFPMASKIDSTKTDQYDIKELSPIFSKIFKQIESTGTELKFKNPKEMIFEFENSLLNISRIPNKKQFLFTMADIKKSPGVIRLETKKRLNEL
ncbi:response regulator, partial [Calditrichota bacterium]